MISIICHKLKEVMYLDESEPPLFFRGLSLKKPFFSGIVGMPNVNGLDVTEDGLALSLSVISDFSGPGPL